MLLLGTLAISMPTDCQCPVHAPQTLEPYRLPRGPTPLLSCVDLWLDKNLATDTQVELMMRAMCFVCLPCHKCADHMLCTVSCMLACVQVMGHLGCVSALPEGWCMLGLLRTTAGVISTCNCLALYTAESGTHGLQPLLTHAQ